MYQFNVSDSVVEVREHLQKLVSRGLLREIIMVKLVKKFAEEKAKAEKQQRYILIMERELV